MTVGIVTDGGVSLGTLDPAGEVIVVPMRLTMDGVEVDEQEELSDPDLASATNVSTSAPSPGDFLKAIESVDDGDGVLVITVAATLSSSFQSAEVAAALYRGEATGSQRMVRVVDSKSATSGQGLVVSTAARASSARKSLDLVADEASQSRDRVRLVAGIAKLDQLVRGGRLPATAAAIGRMAGIRPIFELRSSTIRPLRPAFSAEGAEARILAELRRSAVPGSQLEVLGLFGNDQHVADRLVDRACEFADVLVKGVARLSPVMVAHTGLGVDGLAWLWRTRA